MTQAHETVGSVATKLWNSGGKQGAVETEREANKEYLSEVHKCVQNAVDKGWDKPFYVVVLTKKERLLRNVVRRYFVARKTMPMPDYDQSLWHYDPRSEQLRYVWTIPDPVYCTELMQADDIAPDEAQLAAFVHAFANDQLYDHFAMIYEKDNEWSAEVDGNATKQQIVIT